MGQRLTGMTAFQTKFPTAPSIFKFSQYGQSGAWLSELLPHIGKAADDICIIKSMQTDAINHDPAVTFFQTDLGSRAAEYWRVAFVWAGSESQDLPAFVVMVSQGGETRRRWRTGSGAADFAGQLSGREVPAGSDPVLYLSNPPGMGAGATAFSG
jgi:hypothetical protein